jgi:hypothetical protein
LYSMTVLFGAQKRFFPLSLLSTSSIGEKRSCFEDSDNVYFNKIGLTSAKISNYSLLNDDFVAAADINMLQTHFKIQIQNVNNQ